MIPPMEIFFLGALAAMFIIAGIFFLRFWRESHDWFFFAFSLSFLIRGVNSIQRAFMTRPNIASPWNYLVDLCASLLILGAILLKNLRQK